MAGNLHVSPTGEGELVLDETGKITCSVCGSEVGRQISGIRYDVVRSRGGRSGYAASTSSLLGKVAAKR